MAIPALSLVVPCFNEAAVIRETATRLAHEFERAGVDLELILVDNGSSDATGEIIRALADEGCPVVPRTVEVNRGYGHGILNGLEAARGELVGFTCADGQVDASDVVLVYQIAIGGNVPRLAKVRRRFRMDGAVRKVVSILYNLGTNLLFGGLGTLDINGNPKIWPRELSSKMNLRSRDWFLDAEVILRAKELGVEIYELNVLARRRPGGSSSVGAATCLEFVRNLLVYRLGGKIGRPGSRNSVPS